MPLDNNNTGEVWVLMPVKVKMLAGSIDKVEAPSNEYAKLMMEYSHDGYVEDKEECEDFLTDLLDAYDNYWAGTSEDFYE